MKVFNCFICLLFLLVGQVAHSRSIELGLMKDFVVQGESKSVAIVVGTSTGSNQVVLGEVAKHKMTTSLSEFVKLAKSRGWVEYDGRTVNYDAGSVSIFSITNTDKNMRIYASINSKSYFMGEDTSLSDNDWGEFSQEVLDVIEDDIVLFLEKNINN